MAYEIVETYAGRRMDIRVVKMTDGFRQDWYRVQYQYSKVKNTWYNYTGHDFRLNSYAKRTDGYFEDIARARATARRALRNNN